jgi:hypothetical protein
MSCGLRRLALKTRDLGATERFYVGLLGLTRALDHEEAQLLDRPFEIALHSRDRT